MKLFKNNQGMSLVEIMVAASMLGFLALAGSKLMQNQTQAMKTIEVKSEYNSVLNDIRTILADSASCRQNFSGSNAKTTATSFTTIVARVGVTNVTRFTANANWQQAPAYGNGKVRITNMVLTDAASDVETTAGLAQGTTNLAITFMLGLHPQSKEPQVITKFIKLNVNTNGVNTIITDCNSSVADNSENDMIKACDSIITSIPGTTGYDLAPLPSPLNEKCALMPYPNPPGSPAPLPPGTAYEAVSTAYLKAYDNAQAGKYVNIVGDVMTGHLQTPSLSVGGGLFGGWQFGVAGPGYFLSNLQVNGGFRVLQTTQIDGYTTILSSLQVNGNIEMPSDRALKKDIQDLKDSLTKIKKLKPKAYRWKKTNAPHMGLIAQELALVFPDLVNEKEDGTLTVEYMQLIPVLVGGLQDLEKENTNLKSEIKLIKNELCRENKNYKFCER